MYTINRDVARKTICFFMILQTEMARKTICLFMILQTEMWL